VNTVLTQGTFVVNMNIVYCGLFLFFSLVYLDFETYYQTDNIMLFVSMDMYCVTCYCFWKDFLLVITCDLFLLVVEL